MEAGTGRRQKSRKEEDEVIVSLSLCHVSAPTRFQSRKRGKFPKFLEKQFRCSHSLTEMCCRASSFLGCSAFYSSSPTSLEICCSIQCYLFNLAAFSIFFDLNACFLRFFAKIFVLNRISAGLHISAQRISLDLELNRNN